MLSFSEFANKPPSRRGTVADLVKNTLRKIELSGSNSFLYLNSDAIIDASESDRRFGSGCPRPLEGMLVGVKDNISVNGMPMTCGSRMLENFTAQYDATCVKRLKENGAIIIGKTNLDEFAMGSSGERSYFGKIRNFKFPDRKSGGSSGGSASAVAEGLCHIALGSDTGGSTRIPAAWCGTIGYKPAYGAISRYGLTAFASSLDCVGIIGSSAKDIRLVYSVISGFDENDQTSIKEPPGFGYKNFPKKFAMLSEKNLEGCSAVVIENYQKQASFFKKSGFEIQEIELKYLDYWVSVYQVISSAEAAANFARYDGIRYGYRSPTGNNPREIAVNSRTEAFGAEVKRRIMLGNFILSEGYDRGYLPRAQKLRRLISEELVQIKQQYGNLILPLSPFPPAPANASPKPLHMYETDKFAIGANLAGIESLARENLIFI